MSPRGEPRDRWQRFSHEELLAHYELMMRGRAEMSAAECEGAVDALYAELVDALKARGIVCPYPGGWD